MLSKPSGEEHLCYPNLEEKKLCVIQTFGRRNFVLSKPSGEETLCYPTLQVKNLFVIQTFRRGKFVVFLAFLMVPVLHVSGIQDEIQGKKGNSIFFFLSFAQNFTNFQIVKRWRKYKYYQKPQ